MQSLQAPLLDPAAAVAPYRKKKIPKALREAVWTTYSGRVFEHKCFTSWCPNTITAFDFQTGHNIPESKGGPTTIDNLVPLCSRCNSSMGDHYTFTEWNSASLNAPPSAAPKPKGLSRFFICFKSAATVSPAPLASLTTTSTPEAPATGKSQASRASSRAKP